MSCATALLVITAYVKTLVVIESEMIKASKIGNETKARLAANVHRCFALDSAMSSRIQYSLLRYCSTPPR